MESNKLKKIIWVGPIISEEEEKLFKYSSVAASLWQKKTISLLSNDFEPFIFSMPSEAIFPRGTLWVKKQKVSPLNNVHFSSISYLNLLFVKDLFLSFKLFFYLFNFRKENFIIFSYNTLSSIRLPLLLHKKIRPAFLWVNVNADLTCEESADAVIFLSHFSFSKYRNPTTRFHLDGIVEEGRTTNFIANLPRKLLYFGGYTKWTGIESFIKAFIELDTPNLILCLCGTIPIETQKLIGKNPKIQCIGYLPSSELVKFCNTVDGFVNPRPEEVFGGEFNFPSKILEYLSYGKVIISTRTPGLAPYYKDVLLFYDSRVIDSLKATLEEFSLMTDMDFLSYREKIDNFILKYKRNDKVRIELIGWIKALAEKVELKRTI